MADYYVSFPKLTDLTMHQRLAVDNPNPIFVSGLAGTGKSVCLIYRYITLLKSSNNSTPPHYAYVTFTRTLVAYTKLAVRQNGLSVDSIYTAASFKDKLKSNYREIIKEIIIDELQDLEINEVGLFKQKARSLSVGADFTQQIYEGKVTKSYVLDILCENKKYELEKVFRNSFSILNFITKNWHSTLYSPEELESLKKIRLGRKPVLCIGDNFVFNIIQEYGNSNTHNIAILSRNRDGVDKWRYLLDNEGVDYTYYYSIEDRQERNRRNDEDNKYTEYLSTLHLTTFHSSKGLEFDTVIIPDFENYKKHFTDFKATTIEQRKVLYVAITRAKLNLYLVANKKIDFLKDESTYEILTSSNENDDEKLPF